ncbi:MAG: hypothetical protein K9H26_01725 [Prolixibacteraceae bacterium]|nr:hypothetical protein [Prolixibacteraceae bacterium]
MKKFLFKTVAVSMASLMFFSQAIAGGNFSINEEEEAIVNFNEDEIYSSFDEISELVSYVSENDVTYAEVEAEKEALVENVSSSAALAMGNANAGDPPIVSAFWWGCILNLAGIAIVALTTDMDKDQIMKSVWGCAASTGFWVVFSVTLSLLGAGSYWWYL